MEFKEEFETPMEELGKFLEENVGEFPRPEDENEELYEHSKSLIGGIDSIISELKLKGYSIISENYVAFKDLFSRMIKYCKEWDGNILEFGIDHKKGTVKFSVGMIGIEIETIYEMQKISEDLSFFESMNIYTYFDKYPKIKIEINFKILDNMS